MAISTPPMRKPIPVTKGGQKTAHVSAVASCAVGMAIS